MRCRRRPSAVRPRRAVAALAAAILVLGFIGPSRAEKPRLNLPNTQFEPVVFAELDGWAADDQSAAFAAFMVSCKPILRSSAKMRAVARPLYVALHAACEAAVEAKPKDATEARSFFEQNFRAVRISTLGDSDGLVTGYYEPVVDGSREANADFTAPLRRKPPSLLPGGRMLMAASFTGKKGKAKRAGRKLVPFYERGAIEDGALDGRNLEICYLKDPVETFFAQIQGSVRVRLPDGAMLRLNYDAQNGHAYTAVGRPLIERKHVPREEMSMERIRQWMRANPEEGKEIRRLNKSYVFFRETNLAANEEAIGAQGVSLTPGRSIAVDRNLHVYGTPMFISGPLPIEGEQPTTPFRRLMVAQDTGGAIVGPARADLYFGAGDEAGRVAGRLRHPAKFTMLVPNGIEPFPGTKDTPLPLSRPPAAEMAKLIAAADAAAKLEAAKIEAARKAEAAKVGAANKADAVKAETTKAETETAKPATGARKPRSKARRQR